MSAFTRLRAFLARSSTRFGKTSPSSWDSTRRLYALSGILVLWTGAIGLRLVDLQVLRYGDFTQRAQRQQQRSIEVSPRRGIIYDRNGRELAMSVMVDSIFAVPAEVPDQAGTAALLGRILNVDSREILARMKASHAFCWVARKVDADMAARVRALNLKGIYSQKEPKRFYPKRELAAQALGYVGMDDEGLGGIEREYDEHLRGMPGKMLISMDARRHWFGRVERQPDPGHRQHQHRVLDGPPKGAMRARQVGDELRRVAAASADFRRAEHAVVQVQLRWRDHGVHDHRHPWSERPQHD